MTFEQSVRRMVRVPIQSLPVLLATLGGCAYEAVPASSTAGDVDPSVALHNVRGQLAGLEGYGLVLQNNGTDDIAIGKDGFFYFPAALPRGATYDVRVSLLPFSPLQHCAVQGGRGTVGDEDVEDVRVTCTRGEFPLGGRVSGLGAVGLVLASAPTSDGDDVEEIALATSGTFVFQRHVESGRRFDVTIAQQPEGTTCDLTGGSGVMGSAPRLDIDVVCHAIDDVHPTGRINIDPSPNEGGSSE